MNVRRGEIFYIQKTENIGSEQEAGRPAVIVSNEVNNMHSETAEIVYLTTQPKRDMPTHVTIRATGKESTVLCEQIFTVSSKRIGAYVGICTDEEMEAINDAMMVSLGIVCDELKYQQLETVEGDDTARIERDIYKRLYEELLNKVTER